MSGHAERPLQVLFVCTANISRSPYMELRAKATVGAVGATGVEFASAGVDGVDGYAMDPAMAAELESRGIDPSGFRSRRLAPAMVSSADLVLTAEARHRGVILDEHPAAARRVFTFGQADLALARLDPGVSPESLVSVLAATRGAASASLDIVDPYRRGAEAAAACALIIDGLIERLLPRLQVPA